jgi:hypothetical protein
MIMQPAASPSMPSVMLQAFEVPTTTSHWKATKIRIPASPSVASGSSNSLRNGG